MTTTEVLRRFNRTYTQRIGALDESFLGLGLPLGSARLVFEVGDAGRHGARPAGAGWGWTRGSWPGSCGGSRTTGW